MRHVVYSAWRVFCSCFFKALGRASGKTWILKGTPLFFSAPRVPTCMGKGAEEGEKAMKNTTEILTKEDFSQPTAIIRLTNYYRPGLEYERFALYEATRGQWSIEKDHNITKTRIALAVHDGVVLEVYEIAAWVSANSTMMYFRMDKGDKDRKEFVGNVAKNSIRQKYIGKSVSSLFKNGDIRPVACFGIK